MPAASAAAAATVHLTKKHRKPRRPSMDDASSAGGVSSKSRFSNNMRSNNTGTFYCDKLAKSDEQIRGLLKIKPSHSTFEGSVVFVQRFMRRIREERFRVSAADCIRVGAEVEERRDGLHSLCKCVSSLSPLSLSARAPFSRHIHPSLALSLSLSLYAARSRTHAPHPLLFLLLPTPGTWSSCSSLSRCLRFRRALRARSLSSPRFATSSRTWIKQ